MTVCVRRFVLPDYSGYSLCRVFMNCHCFCRRGDVIQERMDKEQFCVAATRIGGGRGRSVCHQRLLPVVHTRQKCSSVWPHHCHWTRSAVWAHGGKSNIVSKSLNLNKCKPVHTGDDFTNAAAVDCAFLNEQIRNRNRQMTTIIHKPHKPCLMMSIVFCPEDEKMIY